MPGGGGRPAVEIAVIEQVPSGTDPTPVPTPPVTPVPDAIPPITPPLVPDPAPILPPADVTPPPPPIDVVSPIITMLGNNPKTIMLGLSYTDAGATALDAVDGVVNVVSSGAVNTAIIGAYTINYTATDTAGNVATATRAVNVAVFTTSYLENYQLSLPASLSHNHFNYCHTQVTTPPDFYNFGSRFIVSDGGVNLENIGVRGYAGSGTVHSANLYVYAYGTRSFPRSGPLLVTSSTVDPSTWSSASPSGTVPADYPYVYFYFPSTFLPAGTYWFDFGDCPTPSSDYFGVKATISGAATSINSYSNEEWYHFGAVGWDYGNDLFGLSFDHVINAGW